MKTHAILTMLVLLLVAAQPALALENITELRIENIPVIAKAGNSLDFSFSAGNRIGDACTGRLNYWVESSGKKISEGSDSLFLGQGAIEQKQASLLLPSNLSGVCEFHLEMKCNDSVVVANKTIEVKNIIPTMPELGTLEIFGNEEAQQVEFSYALKTNHEEQVPIHVEEKILKDNNVLWTNSQNIALGGNTVLQRFGPVLPPGNYSLTISASHGTETARMTREFRVAPIAIPPMPISLIASIIALAIVLVAALILTGHYLWSAKKDSVHKKILATGATAEQSQTFEEAGLLPNADSVCLVETEASGVLSHDALNGLFDKAGIEEEEKGPAFETATRSPVIQTIKSCVFTDHDGKMTFETIVANTVVNNSQRNWEHVKAIASIPSFFVKDISSISSDTEMQAEQEDSLLRIDLEKIGAKQSASIVYRTTKLISREEASQVSLLAVIGYKKGRKLKIKKVKIKQKKKLCAKKAVLKKKHRQKKEGRKAQNK